MFSYNLCTQQDSSDKMWGSVTVYLYGIFSNPNITESHNLSTTVGNAKITASLIHHQSKAYYRYGIPVQATSQAWIGIGGQGGQGIGMRESRFNSRKEFCFLFFWVFFITQFQMRIQARNQKIVRVKHLE